MSNSDFNEWVRSLEKPFSDYCKKVRGYLLVPSGVEAVVLWSEFLEHTGVFITDDSKPRKEDETANA